MKFLSHLSSVALAFVLSLWVIFSLWFCLDYLFNGRDLFLFCLGLVCLAWLWYWIIRGFLATEGDLKQLRKELKTLRESLGILNEKLKEKNEEKVEIKDFETKDEAPKNKQNNT
jgi:ABC-type multidrug transport system fused ATPase/permease subunit